MAAAENGELSQVVRTMNHLTMDTHLKIDERGERGGGEGREMNNNDIGDWRTVYSEKRL